MADPNGVTDIAVGAQTQDSSRGAVYVLLMNSDGTAKSSTRIANGVGGGPTLASSDFFGHSAGPVGDLDGDGVVDLLVGAPFDDTVGTNRGAMYVLLLNTDGTAKSVTKIASGVGGGGADRGRPDDRAVADDTRRRGSYGRLQAHRVLRDRAGRSRRGRAHRRGRAPGQVRGVGGGDLADGKRLLALHDQLQFEAADGQEAVAVYQRERPDLVTLDIVMPKLDGVSALKQIIEGLHSQGIQTLFYAEGEWNPNLKYIAQLPAGSIVYHVDRGDIFEVHREVGEKFWFYGHCNYPVTGQR